jgi:cell division protease FtsH
MTPADNNPNRRQPTRRPSLPRPMSPIWLGAAVFLALLLANVVSSALHDGRVLQYSEFKTLLHQGQVSDVTIDADNVRGKYLDGAGHEQTFSAVRIEDPKLEEELEAKGVHFTGELPSRWPDILVWVLPFLLIAALWSFFLRRMGGAEGGVMSFARSRAKIYAEDDVKVNFGDVAGVEEAADELKEIVDFLKNPKKYTTLGGRIPKGVLLVGPPGTGKTLLARAVAGEAKVPFFSLSGSEFVEMFVGVGAARVRDLFRQAEVKAPCIVFIDELDALGKVRLQSPMGGHEEREQTLNQLLSEMDGFDARKGVIIMAATNRPEVLDPALLRPGRFDRQVLVDKPDINGREAILRIHVRAVKLAESVDLRVIAARTAGFAGADLANLVNEAALLAARRDKLAVDRADFEEAIDRIIAGLEKKRVMNADERRIVAFHESGHAIVASVLPGLDPVHKISIVQRGFGALGYTMQLPAEDRYVISRSNLESRIAVLLGGRAAESIVFGDRTTGAQNDLLRATDMARAMVTEYGMSDLVGPVNHEHRRRNPFLDPGFPPERGAYAEETARVIDAEVKRIISAAEATARQILLERRTTLDIVSERLLEKEVIEGEELRALMGQTAPPDPPVASTAPTTEPTKPTKPTKPMTAAGD